MGTLGVSGAKVVAGEESIDDGKPGKVIGKSEMSKAGTTAGPFGNNILFHRRWNSCQRRRSTLEYCLWSCRRW